MRQVYIEARSPFRPLRSDTLFGALVWGVREVYGRGGVGKFLSPLGEDPPRAPLLLTSMFPYLDTPEGRQHWFPRPSALECAGSTNGGGWIEDRELLAFVAGREPPDGAAATPSNPTGYYFLAEGRGEPFLEGALSYLERFGFPGSEHAVVRVDTEVSEFLRLAKTGERGLLLSLYHPSDDERAAILDQADDPGISYRIERRAGVTGGRLLDPARRWQRAVAMIREGAILPVVREPAGSAPVVGEADDGGGPFSVVRYGFGFMVPVVGGGR